MLGMPSKSNPFDTAILSDIMELKSVVQIDILNIFIQFQHLEPTTPDDPTTFSTCFSFSPGKRSHQHMKLPENLGQSHEIYSNLTLTQVQGVLKQILISVIHQKRPQNSLRDNTCTDSVYHREKNADANQPEKHCKGQEHFKHEFSILPSVESSNRLVPGLIHDTWNIFNLETHSDFISREFNGDFMMQI